MDRVIDFIASHWWKLLIADVIIAIVLMFAFKPSFNSYEFGGKSTVTSVVFIPKSRITYTTVMVGKTVVTTPIVTHYTETTFVLENGYKKTFEGTTDYLGETITKGKEMHTYHSKEAGWGDSDIFSYKEMTSELFSAHTSSSVGALFIFFVIFAAECLIFLLIFLVLLIVESL